MSVPDTVRHASAQVIFEEYPVVGFNYRMTDIQAAIGREQLARLPAIVARRRELAARYSDRAAAHARRRRSRASPSGRARNWQSYAVRLDEGRSAAASCSACSTTGVATRRGVMNAHREAAYPPGTWRAAGPLDQSERAQDTALVLPLFHQMTADDRTRGRFAQRASVAECGLLPANPSTAWIR